MADLNTGGKNELVEANLDLQIQHCQIMLNEKRNQVKQLEASLDKFKTVEIKKTEYAINYATKEITALEADLKNLTLRANSIDVKAKDSK